MTNTKLNLICVAAVAMLAACGGGSDDTANPGTPGNPGVTPGNLNTTWVAGVYTHPARTYAFETLNKVRGITGVGYLKQNSALDNAAQSHTEYFRLNPGMEPDHIQKPGYAGFTGATPNDRATHFGYKLGASEDLAGSGNDMQSLWKLLGAPYHSLDLIGSYSDVGVGVWPNALLVINPGAVGAQNLDSSAVAIYPCNNIQVNIQGQGYEQPNPAVLNGKQDFGYSSVAKVRQGQKLEVTSWELRDASGNLVPTVVMTQANDTNKYFQANDAALIPLNALPRTASSYTSVLKGKNNGIPFEKSCTWRTVAGETVPQN